MIRGRLGSRRRLARLHLNDQKSRRGGREHAGDEAWRALVLRDRRGAAGSAPEQVHVGRRSARCRGGRSRRSGAAPGEAGRPAVDRARRRAGPPAGCGKGCAPVPAPRSGALEPEWNPPRQVRRRSRLAQLAHHVGEAGLRQKPPLASARAGVLVVALPAGSACGRGSFTGTQWSRRAAPAVRCASDEGRGRSARRGRRRRRGRSDARAGRGECRR
jgi:hypothetical protein